MSLTFRVTRIASVIGLAHLSLASSPVYAACPSSVTPAESPAGAQIIGSSSACTVETGASISTAGNNNDAIRADDLNTIINNGTITTTGDSADGIVVDEDNSILNTGVISTTGSDATGVTVDNLNTVINRGSIIATGVGADAIRADNQNTIGNAGVITTTGISADGIEADNENTITNTGTISTTGDVSQGIQAGSRNTVTNSGTILVTGDDGEGIIAIDENVIANSGLISTSGISNAAVDVDDRNAFTNTGAIRTTGDDSDGLVTDDANTIINSGLISTSGDGADGIFIDGTANIITNRGAVLATGSNSSSVNLRNDDNTINLLQGSRIVGLISFSGGAMGNTVNLGRGENWLMTFSEDPRLTNNLNTLGVPTTFLNGGLTVATFDAASTAFGAENDALSDLTGAINAGLHQRLTAGNPTTYLWAQGFGATRSTDNSNLSGPGVRGQELSGGMAGFSVPLGSWARGGLFGGYAESSINGLASGSIGDGSLRHTIDQESWFAGAYGRAFWGQAFADLIVTGGETGNDSRRRVLNNLAPTGVEFATGGYDGWFVNPELTLGLELPFAASAKLVPSASVGYAGHYLDGLTEAGSQAAIALAARDIELIDGRLQLELRNTGATSLGTWHTALRAGIKYRSSIGDDDLAGVLAATTAFSVAMQDSDDVLASFAGADLTFSIAPGVQVFAGGDATFEDDGDSVYAGRAGGAVKF